MRICLWRTNRQEAASAPSVVAHTPNHGHTHNPSKPERPVPQGRAQTAGSDPKGSSGGVAGGRAHSLKILASLGGTVSMLSSTRPSARSAAHCTLAGASPFTIMDCTTHSHHKPSFPRSIAPARTLSASPFAEI